MLIRKEVENETKILKNFRHIFYFWQIYEVFLKKTRKINENIKKIIIFQGTDRCAAAVP
jgi:hypothetical protein